MKLSQIVEKPDKELDQLITDQRQALAQQAIDMTTKKVSNVKQIAAIKRTIAQALTIRRQRQIAEAEKPATANKGESNG